MEKELKEILDGIPLDKAYSTWKALEKTDKNILNILSHLYQYYGMYSSKQYTVYIIIKEILKEREVRQ